MAAYTSLIGGQTQSTNGSQNVPPVNMINTQMAYVMQPRPTEYTNYRKKQSLGLGVLQIIVGALCIIFNGVALGFLNWGSWSPVIAHGIWGGILFIITGSFGVGAAKSATKCKVVTFMVLCIISACTCTVLVALGIIGSFVSSCQTYRSYYDYSRGIYRYDYYDDPGCMAVRNTSIAMNALIACLGFIECIAAIWGSANCCKVACCCSNSNKNIIPAPIQLVTIPGNQQIFTVPQQQVFAVPLQQQAHPGQVNFAYPQGYPSQPMVNVAAPPYQANPNAPPYEIIQNASPKTAI